MRDHYLKISLYYSKINLKCLYFNEETLRIVTKYNFFKISDFMETFLLLGILLMLIFDLFIVKTIVFVVYVYNHYSFFIKILKKHKTF